MTTRGPTTKFAIDAQAVVAFLDFHSTRVLDGTPKRWRHLINGCAVDSDTDARIIRRWRTTTLTTTRGSATRLLGKFNLTLEDLITWFPTNPIIRGAL